MSEKSSVPAKATEMRPRRWDPFALLSEMEAEMERLFNERWPITPFVPARLARRLLPSTEVWTPRADIFEQDGALVVKAELPGVKKEDIEVAVEDGDLVIRGERKAEEKVEEKDYYRMERFYGSFYRRIPLPEGTDPEKIEANYQDGVLTVRVPKAAATQPEPKKIPIR